MSAIDTSPGNIELRHRSPVAPSSDDTSHKSSALLDPDPSASELEAYRKSTSGDPPSSTLTSASSFRTLVATNTASGNIKLASPTAPDSTIFYVTNGSLKRNTASVILAHASDKGPVLGTLKLGWGRDNTFGVGDPAKGEAIAWENLQRTSEWTHATYEFEVGDETGRRHFVWQRTKQGIFSDQPNMELRETGVDGIVGEVLAVYTGNQGMMWKSRGQFSLSPILSSTSKPSWEGANDGSWSELELMALISGLGIIEGSRRWARARRGGAAGGGGGS